MTDLKVQDPFRAQTFYLELTGIYDGPILKVTGLTYEREVKTKNQSLGKGRILLSSTPGQYKPGTITVHKAVSKERGFWNWRKRLLTEQDISKVRVNGTVRVTGDGGKEIEWHLTNAWPSRIKGPTLDVGSDKAIEEIEICYQELHFGK
jgi:phage tail-like protein